MTPCLINTMLHARNVLCPELSLRDALCHKLRQLGFCTVAFYTPLGFTFFPRKNTKVYIHPLTNGCFYTTKREKKSGAHFLNGSTIVLTV